jgi:hypothetical protein
MDNDIKATVTIVNATHGKRIVKMRFKSLCDMQHFQSKMTHAQPTQQHINIVEHKQGV